jgi:hypothetical protein
VGAGEFFANLKYNISSTTMQDSDYEKRETKGKSFPSYLYAKNIQSEEAPTELARWLSKQCLSLWYLAVPTTNHASPKSFMN